MNMRRPSAAPIFFASLISVAFTCLVFADPSGDSYAVLHQRDFDMVYQLIKPLADQGDAHAQYRLGLMYQLGEGVPEDRGEAIRWYRKAADQGDTTAQYDLGFMYSKGEGVQQNYVMALMWSDIAASRIPVSDTEEHKAAVALRDNIASKMTPEQIAEAQRMAKEWKPKKER
jgi:TPR repeat protein